MAELEPAAKAQGLASDAIARALESNGAGSVIACVSMGTVARGAGGLPHARQPALLSGAPRLCGCVP